MLGCVINSSSADVQRRRGTRGGGEPEYHPAPAPPWPITGDQQPTQRGTWAGGETSVTQAEEWSPCPSTPQGCPKTAIIPRGPAGKPSIMSQGERFYRAPRSLRSMGRIMGCRQEHSGIVQDLLWKKCRK